MPWPAGVVPVSMLACAVQVTAGVTSRSGCCQPRAASPRNRGACSSRRSVNPRGLSSTSGRMCGGQPWVRIDRVEADVPLTDLLAGRLPSNVRLSGVKVTLRFDAEGRLLTELPPRPDSASAPLGTLPEIEVTDSQVFLLGTQDR